MKKNFNFAKAINLALHDVMSKNQRSVCMGLGINDPKRIFGTTEGLVETYGEARVIEPPTSENALTGIAFGLSLKEYAVCLTHQRLDFALLSFDQIINTIAKWSFMFDKNFNTSILIRLIIGRGWGQGPTHSQSYHSFLSSIPGLNVFYPTSPISAYETVKYAMSSGKPSIMIEHRWLHQTEGIEEVKDNFNFDNIRNMKVLTKGKDLSIFTYGYMVPEALKAVSYCKNYGINIELLIKEKINDIDILTLLKSIRKTKKIILIEPYFLNCSTTSTLCTKLCEEIVCSHLDIQNMKVISLPFENESSSYFDTKDRYLKWTDIVEYIDEMLEVNMNLNFEKIKDHDVPGQWFKGPF